MPNAVLPANLSIPSNRQAVIAVALLYQGTAQVSKTFGSFSIANSMLLAATFSDEGDEILLTPQGPMGQTTAIYNDDMINCVVEVSIGTPLPEGELPQSDSVTLYEIGAAVPGFTQEAEAPALTFGNDPAAASA